MEVQMSILKRIRASLGFSRLLDVDLLARARSILSGMTGNGAYPHPPVDLAAFGTLLQMFADAIAASLDGSKKAIAERRKRRAEILSKLRLLGLYVQEMCQDDLGVLMSSGFEAAAWSRKSPQPLPAPAITSVDQGQTGQLLVRIRAAPGAQSYELRHGAVETGGPPGAWTTTYVSGVKRAMAITGLAPGTVYAFQVRTVNAAGYTDWSDSITRMCI
jgi:hypothetical protein